MIGYCNVGWMVVLTVVIGRFFFCKLCGGICIVGVGGGINDGFGDSSLAHHHHQIQ